MNEQSPQPNATRVTPSEAQSPAEDSVILSEARSAESKDPHSSPQPQTFTTTEESTPLSSRSRPGSPANAFGSLGWIAKGSAFPAASPDRPNTLPPYSQATFFERWLTYLLQVPLMAASTAFFGSLALLCAFWDKTGRQQHTIASIWGRSLLEIALSPVETIGLEKVEGLGPAVYASNHLSYMDTPVLFGKLPFQFRILAKASLWQIPFIGWYLGRSGQVPIDQKTSRSSISGLLAGAKTLKSGLPIVLFPEGSRSPDGSIRSMMSGCAFMAIRAGVPLVPLALIGTRELLPMHVYHLAPRPLKLIVGDPIPTTGRSTRDADALTQQLYDAITSLYIAHQ